MQAIKKVDVGNSALFDYLPMRCQNEAPFPILEMALEKTVDRSNALDIGSDTSLEVRRMIEAGFEQITAIDQVCCEDLYKLDSDIVTIEKCLVEEYKFLQDAFDLVSALFVLPFVQRQQLARVVTDIASSLKKGGIFVATFFGEKDFRAGDVRVNTLTDAEINYLVRDMKILRVHEFEGLGNAFGREEDVHVYRYITQK